MTFQEFGLSPQIMRALEESGYEKPSPIQRKAIPMIKTGRDIIACAQTGTGKTAAFSLPLIEKIQKNTEKWRSVRVLILSPTRELAEQIVNNISTYSKYLPVRCAAIYGGVSVKEQVRTLQKGVHIVVATPGRLLDHIKQKTIDLSHVESLVLDEADRMLDMGFIRDVRRITASLPRQGRQNLLFSATFSQEIKDLTKELLHQPRVIQVAHENKPVKIIDQRIYQVDRGRRKSLLVSLVNKEEWRQVLVFTRTKRGANRLAEQLSREGLQAEAFHGNKSQNARLKSLEDFKRGETRILVATDIAARGIDIQDLPHVVNFDLPEVAENYVHRIGRTGRAGKTGQAVSLVSIDDEKLLRQIESLIKEKIPKTVFPGFEPDPNVKPREKPRVHLSGDRNRRNNTSSSAPHSRRKKSKIWRV